MAHLRGSSSSSSSSSSGRAGLSRAGSAVLAATTIDAERAELAARPCRDLTSGDDPTPGDFERLDAERLQCADVAIAVTGICACRAAGEQRQGLTRVAARTADCVDDRRGFGVDCASDCASDGVAMD